MLRFFLDTSGYTTSDNDITSRFNTNFSSISPPPALYFFKRVKIHWKYRKKFSKPKMLVSLIELVAEINLQ